MKLLMTLVFLFTGVAHAQQGLGVLQFDYLDLDTEAKKAMECVEVGFKIRYPINEGSKSDLIVEVVEDGVFTISYLWGLGKSFRCVVSNESELNRIVKNQLQKLKADSDTVFKFYLSRLEKEESGLIRLEEMETMYLETFGKSAEDALGKFSLKNIKMFAENPYSNESHNIEMNLQRMLKNYSRMDLVDKVAVLMMMEYNIPSLSYQLN